MTKVQIEMNKERTRNEKGVIGESLVIKVFEPEVEMWINLVGK